MAVSSGTVNHPLIIEDVVMESSPDLIPGQTLAVFYEDDTLWHERLLLWRLNDGCWFVLTPDLDIYAEDVSGSGVDGPGPGLVGHLTDLQHLSPMMQASSPMCGRP